MTEIREADPDAHTDPTLSVERVGDGVVVLRVCRGPHNYFDEQLIAALATRVQMLSSDGDTRAVVLASEGKNFCAGANFGRQQDSTGKSRGLYAWALDLLATDLPVIAAVQGSAIGGGLGLALVADLRVGSPTTKFVANFVRLGLSHGFAITETLTDLVGRQRALDLLVTGRAVRGDEALSLGLLDRLVDDSEIEETALAEARAIARNAPLAVRAVRGLLRAERHQRLREAVRAETRIQGELMQTRDFKEGVRAAAERRPAVFRAE